MQEGVVNYDHDHAGMPRSERARRGKKIHVLHDRGVAELGQGRDGGEGGEGAGKDRTEG